MFDATSIDTFRLAGQPRSPGSWAGRSRPAPDVLRWVDVPGARLRVRWRQVPNGAAPSEAPAVVFLLDPPNLVEHYDAHCDGLTGPGGAASAVAVIELPGFGFSYPKRGFGWRLEDYVRSIGAALDALFAPGEFPAGVVLVAPCVCVYIALRLAAERPRQIVKLVLAQAPCWQEERAWAERLDWHPPIVARPYVGQVAMMLGARGAARRWYRAAAGERAAVPRLTKTMEEAVDHGACFCLASFTQRWFGRREPEPAIAPVTQPTLFLWGERDRSHRLSTPRSGLEAYVPTAQWEPLADTGHFPDLEHTPRFLERLSGFIQQKHRSDCFQPRA